MLTAEQVNASPRKLATLWGKRRAPPHIQEQVAQSEPEVSKN